MNIFHIIKDVLFSPTTFFGSIEKEKGIKKPGLLRHVARYLEVEERIGRSEAVFVDDIEAYTAAGREMGFQVIRYNALTESITMLMEKLEELGVEIGLEAREEMQPVWRLYPKNSKP